MNWKQIWKPLLAVAASWAILLGLSAGLQSVAQTKQQERHKFF